MPPVTSVLAVTAVTLPECHVREEPGTRALSAVAKRSSESGTPSHRLASAATISRRARVDSEARVDHALNIFSHNFPTFPHDFQIFPRPPQVFPRTPKFFFHVQTPCSGGISNIRTWFQPCNAWRLNITILEVWEKVEGSGKYLKIV